LEIKDLKELERLIKMCRKHGITEFGLGNFACKINPLPARQSQSQVIEDEDSYQGETLDENALDQLVGMPVNPSDEELIEWGLTGQFPEKPATEVN